MAYVDVIPTSPAAEERLMVAFERIRLLVRACIEETFKVPASDILVMAHHNTVMIQDSEAVLLGVVPQLLIKINTSDTKLKKKAKALKDALLKEWEENFGTDFPIEIWIGFFHTWGTNIEMPQ